MLDLVDEPEWEVQEIQGGAFIKNIGLNVTYLAPQVGGTYHVILKARAADGTAIKQIQEIQVLPVIQIEPASATVHPGDQIQVTARVKGSSNQSVLWTVEEPKGGRITPDGLYTAPSQPGTYHILASQSTSPASAGRATVRVE
jgi:hypothetical protein